MRIVGGRHRSRRLAAIPPGLDLRPTSDRARQAMFDVLEHAMTRADGRSRLRDAVVLDAFCGCGALALEALSRGAARATLMDSDPRALAVARANLAACGETARAALLRVDALAPPPSSAGRGADLVFLDPPYGQDLVPRAVVALRAAGWLAPDALIVAETEAGAGLDAQGLGVATIDDRRYGKARVRFLRGD